VDQQRNAADQHVGVGEVANLLQIIRTSERRLTDLKSSLKGYVFLIRGSLSTNPCGLSHFIPRTDPITLFILLPLVPIP
jgi:hypothetical protein